MAATTIRNGTVADINKSVEKVLRGLGNPGPPLDLRLVRELLKLDRQYYSTTDTGLLGDTLHKMKVAGKQVLQRPTILLDAIAKFSIKALYLPDQKRILLDESLPPLKHRWNEAHEISHDLLPWHNGMMFGDTEHTLSRTCHDAIEAEANYAAGRLLFLGDQFCEMAEGTSSDFSTIQGLSKSFGNTLTSTMWRYIEMAPDHAPMFGTVSCHPHPSKRLPNIGVPNECRYFIKSKAFGERFANVTGAQIFSLLEQFCCGKSGGILGVESYAIPDDNNERHEFRLETFFNRYEALTVGAYISPEKHMFSLGI